MSAMARPKEQTARRREIVDAAGRAIVDRGVLGLRVKDVAAEAGISPGLVSYYFPDLDDLLVDLHEHSVDRFYWDRMKLVESRTTAPDRLRALVDGGIPDKADDPLNIVLYELHLHAARNRTHATLMTSLWDREVSLYTMVLHEGEARGELTLIGPAADIASTAVALEDAFGLHVVGRNRRLDGARSRELLLDYLSQATGTDLHQDGGHG